MCINAATEGHGRYRQERNDEGGGMSSDNGNPFECRHSVFGAYDNDGLRLLLVVEAPTIAEAKRRVLLVAPMTAAGLEEEVMLVEFEELPEGVPTFMQAYFDEMAVGGEDTYFHVSNGVVH
jgi:hypothetical protein